jgi:predicted ribosomally synthesized peptide with SipW-like signal peptide
MKDNENNDTKTNTLLLTVIGVATLMVAVIGATFAYFTANGNSTGESASTINLKAGKLTVTYGDGTDTIVATNIEPKAAVLGTKTFTITGNNTTNTTMYYTLILDVTENTFTGSNYDASNNVVETGGTHEDFIKFELASTNTGGNGTPVAAIAKTAITTGAHQITLGTGSFEELLQIKYIHIL